MGTRVLVPRSIADKAVEKMVAFVGNRDIVKIGNPADPGCLMGPVVREERRRDLQKLAGQFAERLAPTIAATQRDHRDMDARAVGADLWAALGALEQMVEVLEIEDLGMAAGGLLLFEDDARLLRRVVVLMGRSPSTQDAASVARDLKLIDGTLPLVALDERYELGEAAGTVVAVRGAASFNGGFALAHDIVEGVNDDLTGWEPRRGGRGAGPATARRRGRTRRTLPRPSV